MNLRFRIPKKKTENLNLNKPETKLWIQIRSQKQSFEFDFKLKVGSKASISNSNENSGMNLRRWIRRFDFENEAYAKKRIVLLGFHRKEFNISLIKISVPYKTRSLLLRKVGTHFIWEFIWSYFLTSSTIKNN